MKRREIEVLLFWHGMDWIVTVQADREECEVLAMRTDSYLLDERDATEAELAVLKMDDLTMSEIHWNALHALADKEEAGGNQ